MSPDWLRAYEAILGPLPESYLVIDLETAGLSKKDYILQVGWCEVRNCRVVSNCDEILNWTDYKGTDCHWLASRMSSACRSMEGDGLDYKWNLNVLRDGYDPIDVLSLLFNRLLEWDTECLPVVGHNFVNFDVRMLSEAGFRHLGYPYRPDDRRVIDTAALEKAQQAGLLPRYGETHGAFFRRVLATKSKDTSYTLDGCIRRRQLDVINSLDMSQAHHAGFDCLMCYHLLESYRASRGNNL